MTSPAQIVRPPSPPSPSKTHSTVPTQHRPRHHQPNLSRPISRRDLSIVAAAAAVLPLLLPSRARAEPSCSGNKTTTKTAFLDIAIDGDPAGRITVALYGDAAPLGSERFAALVTGAVGISYRRKEFVKITPGYIQHGGVRSYGVDADLARRSGSNLVADGLVTEWEAAEKRCPAGETRNVAGSVGIVVRDPTKPPPKLKLVARKGRLEVDEEEVGTEPNGTEFVIAAKDSPELDGAALVVGKVVGGMDVVERVAKVKTVQENKSSPYFRTVTSRENVDDSI